MTVTHPLAAAGWYHHVYGQLAACTSSSDECAAVTRQLLAHHLDYTPTAHVAGSPLTCSPAAAEALQLSVSRLQAGEPIQYVLGEVEFLGCRLHVDQRVLIPRPETEEMVAQIIQAESLEHKKVLDLCTGSGCIAIALKRGCPEAEVTALDCCIAALQVAGENAAANGVQVELWQYDLLYDTIPGQWHLMVSNPPYVPWRERAHMHARVVDHEPSSAIFVSDSYPVLFYDRLARLAREQLFFNGRLYTEVHAPYAEEVARLYQAQGLQEVNIHLDIHGRKRWVSATQKQGGRASDV